MYRKTWSSIKSFLTFNLFWPRAFLRILPIATFLTFQLWGWRIRDIFHEIPGYGDVLEVMWGLRWYAEQLATGSNPFFFPAVFHPTGWQVGTLAHGPILLIAMTPLYWFGGQAFAYNISIWVIQVFAFGGMYRLARRWLPIWTSVIATITFTFWAYRWVRIAGHLHMFAASACLPWMVIALERVIHEKRTYLWSIVGIVWGISITLSTYFVWLAGAVLLLWILIRLQERKITWQNSFIGICIASTVSLTLSGPSLWVLFNAFQQNAVEPFEIGALLHWGASVNGIFNVSIHHPWPLIKSISQTLYTGNADEMGTVALGIASVMTSIVGILNWQVIPRQHRAFWVLTLVGIIFALGPMLRYNGQFVPCVICDELNEMLWGLGRLLKPAVFTTPISPDVYLNGLPLPHYLMIIFVPFIEGARISARYSFIANFGLSLAIAITLTYTRSKIVRLIIILALIIEVLPARIEGQVYPPKSHPALDWLAHFTPHSLVVLDLYVNDSLNKLDYLPRGEILLATDYHQQVTVSAIGSFLTQPARVIYDWLVLNSQPLLQPDFLPLLSAFNVNYILIHNAPDEILVRDHLRLQSGISIIDCFESYANSTLWKQRICVLAVASNPPSVVFDFGWSPTEDWGRWMIERRSEARWPVARITDYTLQIEAFPNCVSEQQQTLEITVNNHSILQHQWQDCEPWASEVTIPADVLKIGWNDVSMFSAYARQPIDSTTGKITDSRALSVGFSRLSIISP